MIRKCPWAVPADLEAPVVLTVYPLTHISEDQVELSVGDFRTALYVKNGALQPTELSWVAGDVAEQGSTLKNVSLTTDIDDFNGILISGDNGNTPYVIENAQFRTKGSGTSEGRGANLMTVGTSNVKLDGARIWNDGTLTAIVASGHSHLEVANSVIYGARDFTVGKLCPWVLSINGNNRLTNAIDYAQVDYHDSIVVAQSWAALSTDSGKGVRLTGERLFSGIGRLEPYDEAHKSDYTATPEVNGEKYGFYLGNSAIGECGYVNYADAGFHNSFKECDLLRPGLCVHPLHQAGVH